MRVPPIARLTSSAVQSDWRLYPSAGSVVLRCDSDAGAATVLDSRGERGAWDDPLAALDWMEAQARGGALPPGCRWVGYIGYDAGRWFEHLPPRTPDPLRLPRFVFSLHDRTEPLRDCAAEFRVRDLPLESTFTRTAYEAAVSRAIAYIEAGDVFQVNLSQRLSCGLPAQPASLFDRLRARAPALYGACLVYEDFALLSSSPELFLRVSPLPDGRRRVVTRPIKGTRPAGDGMAAQLRDSVKDEAELNMIVDLERNDLGRVCEIGTVKVTQPRAIEAHPTVYHGVATVEGVLRPDVSFVDLLRATFPGGSVTGAPKIRAMQIIDELEPVRRGPYCGAIGYFDSDGTMEFSIAIRTMIVTADGIVHVPVGGGVVADSDPAAEYEETRVKARAMLEALGVKRD